MPRLRAWHFSVDKEVSMHRMHEGFRRSAFSRFTDSRAARSERQEGGLERYHVLQGAGRLH